MLSVETFGNGPDLVLLHGWGMHSGVMMPWAQELAKWFRVSLVDLPGHGNSGAEGLTRLEDWAAAVLDVVPADAWWLGWSLGGLVALTATQLKSGFIRGAALVAATPKFVASPDWQPAVNAQVFDQFGDQLRENVERTLVRFVSLQARGTDGSSQVTRRLRAELGKRPQANANALISGLDFLKNSDLRNVLENTDMPVYWLLGARDTLVPKQLGTALPGDRVSIVEGAGHAPFLSHSHQCTEQLRRWFLDQRERNSHAAD